MYAPDARSWRITVSPSFRSCAGEKSACAASPRSGNDGGGDGSCGGAGVGLTVPNSGSDPFAAGCDAPLVCAAARLVTGAVGTQQSAAATVDATMRRLRLAKVMGALKKGCVLFGPGWANAKMRARRTSSIASDT